MTEAPGRVRCVDWLRGLAVFDMIMWHAGCMLRKDLDVSTLAWLSGLVACSFIFAAGFALAIVMVRTGGDPAARKRRALRSLRRIVEVLAIAFALKFILRRAEPHWMLKIDILTCIALSLLLALPPLLLGAGRPLAASGTCAILGIACFAAAPMIADGAWGVFITPHSSDFPLVPWAGYAFLGAAAGGLASMGLTGTALGAMFLLSFAFRFLPWNFLYGNAGPIVDAGERIMAFGGTALALYAIEREADGRGWKLDWPPFSLLELVGTNALTAYVVHVWLLYVNTPVINFSCWGAWGGKLGWTAYWIALLGLWAAVLLACVAWPKLSKALAARMPWTRD